MSAFLLDTNVISEYAEPIRGERVVAWMAAQAPADLFLSAITLAEPVRGTVRMVESRRREALSRWIQDELRPRFEGRILPFDGEAAVIWGRILGAGDRRGRPMPILDARIAAISIRRGLVLATRNVADFRGMNIMVFNPWDPV